MRTGAVVNAADLPRVIYTADQQMRDVNWILRNILERNPRNTDVSPSVLSDMFYCEADGKSQFIGDTKMTIREGLWLIIQAIEDTKSVSPDGRQVSAKEKYDNLIKTLCDAANALPATILTDGTRKGRKSTCVRGLRKVLSECLLHQHKAFDRKLSIDQVARENAAIYAICPMNPQTGLGSKKLEHVLRAKKVIFSDDTVSRDILQFSSFADILTILRRLALDELCQVKNTIGESPQGLVSFSLLTRLMAATGVIYQASNLAPTEDYSILRQPFGGSQSCLEANPRLMSFGPFASAAGSFDPDEGDLQGKERCLTAHAKQVLRAFGLCPGTPGTKLGSHLKMLARAAYGKRIATDPECWEDTCFPAMDDREERPLYARASAGARVHPLAKLVEMEGDAQTKAQIQTLERTITPAAAARVALVAPWVNNESKRQRLDLIREEVMAIQNKDAIERGFVTRRAEKVRIQASRPDPRYGYGDRAIDAFQNLRRLPTHQGAPLNPAIAALQSQIGEYPFAPTAAYEISGSTDQPQDRHGEDHYRNIALVLHDLSLIADDTNTGVDIDILKAQAAFHKREIERKRNGWHKYDYACQFLKLFKSLH